MGRVSGSRGRLKPWGKSLAPEPVDRGSLFLQVCVARHPPIAGLGEGSKKRDTEPGDAGRQRPEADLPAGSAVCGIFPGIDASAVALRQLRIAFDLAGPRAALHAAAAGSGAGFRAAATIGRIALRVYAFTRALGFVLRALRDAHAGGAAGATSGRRFALLGAGPAVLRIARRVHTRATAKCGGGPAVGHAGPGRADLPCSALPVASAAMVV